MRTARATDHPPPLPDGIAAVTPCWAWVGPAVIADPVPFYRAVAELPSVYWDETSKVWVCRGYAEVSAVLRDHSRFRSGRRHSSDALDARGMAEAAQVQQLLDQQLLFLDPPDHATARDALRTAFTPAATAGREPVVAGIVRDLLDRLPRQGAVRRRRGLRRPPAHPAQRRAPRADRPRRPAGRLGRRLRRPAGERRVAAPDPGPAGGPGAAGGAGVAPRAGRRTAWWRRRRPDQRGRPRAGPRRPERRPTGTTPRLRGANLLVVVAAATRP